MTNPFNSIQPQQRPVNPFDSVGGVNPFDGAASSRAPVTDDRPEFGERYVGAIKEIVTHPGDAIVGMAKAVLLDALKATVTPVKMGDATIPGPLGLLNPVADIAARKLLPRELT